MCPCGDSPFSQRQRSEATPQFHGPSLKPSEQRAPRGGPRAGPGPQLLAARVGLGIVPLVRVRVKARVSVVVAILLCWSPAVLALDLACLLARKVGLPTQINIRRMVYGGGGD